MFIRNAWYVAGHADEIASGELIRRRIMDEDIVLFRTLDGRFVALENRCPHRLLPLSMGTLTENGLQCGYHGATFGADGRCTWLPGEAEISDDVRVRAYPVREKYGFLWLWPGAPELSEDESTIPEFLEYGEASYHPANGSIMSFAADYRLIVDNLLDAAHASFVHATTLGTPLWQLSAKDAVEENTEFDFSVEDRGIQYQYSAKNTITGPAFAQAYARKSGMTEWNDRLDINLDVQWSAPSVFIFSSITRGVGEKPEEGIGLINLHALTPESERSTHYFFRNGYRFHEHSDEFRSFWHDTATRAFNEDKVVIEEQQRSLGERDVFDYELVSFPGDRLGFQGRHILNRLAEDEAAQKN